MPLQVVPGSGSGPLASPIFTACDTVFGLPPMLSSKLPDQLPLYTQKQAEGSEKTEQIFTKAPHDFGPTISDYVGDLSRTWGNFKDWMLEFWDGRKIVIPLSAYRSPNSVSD